MSRVMCLRCGRRFSCIEDAATHTCQEEPIIRSFIERVTQRQESNTQEGIESIPVFVQSNENLERIIDELKSRSKGVDTLSLDELAKNIPSLVSIEHDGPEPVSHDEPEPEIDSSHLIVELDEMKQQRKQLLSKKKISERDLRHHNSSQT